jgi:hypothetical protein
MRARKSGQFAYLQKDNGEIVGLWVPDLKTGQVNDEFRALLRMYLASLSDEVSESNCFRMYSAIATGGFVVERNDPTRGGGYWLVIPSESKLSTNADKTKQESKCFIATACYGTSDYWKLYILQLYRDEKLCKTRIGSSIIEIYYLISPAIAAIIRDIPILKKTIRRILDYFVDRLLKKGFLHNILA